MTISVPVPNTTVPSTGAPGITYHGRSQSPNPITLHNEHDDDMNKEKPEIYLDEHAIGFDGEDADPNSPAAILKRYPLLRNMTGEELERLNKQTRRRIDIWMLPMLTLMLFINYLDRSNVTNARVAGMQKDLHMSDVEWSAGISLFYVGYIITQLPGSLILSRFKPRIIMPAMMILWSIPTICMPLCTSPAGFMVIRFLVGFFEGPFFPGVALMTSSWYVKDELPFRMAVWHGAQTLSNVFGGPLAAGVLETMDGKGGLPAWKWFLLIEGAVSILVGVLGYFCLPNWADNTTWLTDEQSEMAQYRLVLSAGGMDETKQSLTIWEGARLALKDPFTYLFMCMHFMLIVAQSFKDFLPTIISTLGKGKLLTYLLQSPAYLLGYFAILGFGWSAGHFKDATWHIASLVAPMVGSAVGTAMLISTENIGVRYTGICLLIMGVYSGLNIQISWETSVIPSPRHKKAAVIALANSIASASHWFTPYFFLRNQEPLYRLGGGLILFGCGATILTVFATRWRCNKLNRALDVKELEENTRREESGQEPLEKGWRFPT